MIHAATGGDGSLPYVAVGDNTRTDKTGKLPWRVPENSLWVHRSMTDRQKELSRMIDGNWDGTLLEPGDHT